MKTRTFYTATALVAVALCMLIAVFVTAFSGPDYPTMNTKNFLFNHQDIVISIDGGPKLDKNLTPGQISKYCSNGGGRLLSIYLNQGGNSFAMMGELILTGNYQQISDTDLFVKAGSG